MKKWQLLYYRCQPYAVIIMLLLVARWMPYASLFILSMLNWTALDALMSRKAVRDSDDAPAWPYRLGLSLASQFRKVDEGHRFAGNEVVVISQNTYHCGGNSFVVSVERSRATADA